MIKHKIVVKREQIVTHPPWSNRVITKLYPTEELFRKYLAEQPYNVGDLVTWSTNEKIVSSWQVHIIIQIKTDYPLLDWSFKGEPMCFQFSQVFNPTHWIRWDNIRDYRFLSTEEYDEWAAPRNVEIQNHKQEYCQFPQGE